MSISNKGEKYSKIGTNFRFTFLGRNCHLFFFKQQDQNEE